MSSIRKFSVLLTVIVLVFSLIAPLAAQDATPTPNPECAEKIGEGLRIAFIPQLIGIPYFTAMEEGGQEAAECFGGEFLYVGAPTASAAEQVRLMENLIEQGVDAIAISVLDSASLNPVMERAEEAGIVVFTSDSDSPESVRDLYVAQALDQELGYTLIDVLVEQIGGAGQIGIVSGESTATNLNTWIEYMEERVAEEYPDVEIVDIRYTTGGSSEDALRQAEELMIRFPEIKGIVAVASTTVPGVAQAIEQAGMTGEIKVIGYGSPNTVRPYIESGVMEASILWDPKALGYLTFWAGVQLVNGEEFEEENEVVGMEEAIRFFEEDGILLLGEPLVITAENIDDFDF